jgi:hypothetical protein
MNAKSIQLERIIWMLEAWQNRWNVPDPDGKASEAKTRLVELLRRLEDEEEAQK